MVTDKVIENYAIGGAIAAIFYIEPFATSDVDVFIPMPVSAGNLLSLSPIYEYLASLGYLPNKEHSESIDIENWPVQFLPAFDELINESLQNAKTFDVDGVRVKVMPPEHLVVIMLRTGRAKDLARVEMFIEQEKVDIILQNLANQFELEKLFKVKEEARKKRADLPIVEKLKIVERLRDAQRLIKNAKEISKKN
jgi:predicted nucleotidyltransferase